MNNELLEEIMQVCPRKKVISLCNKLLKKCSFKSGTSTSQLRELAYWLYIYGFEVYIPKLAAPTHNIPFVLNYNVWEPIFDLWGLEIRLLKAAGRTEEAEAIIHQIDEYYLVPPMEGQTREYMLKCEAQRRNNDIFSYPECTNRDRIADASTKATANGWKLSALFRMIGDGATGLYPRMNAEAEAIEKTIQSYIADLREVR